MSLPAQQRLKISYEEFLSRLDEDTAAEWVEGEVVYLSPASLEHQDIVGWLMRYLGEFVERSGVGQLIPPPFQIRLRRSERGWEPDLLFVAQENLHRLHTTYLEGGADLVVEVTSPESLVRDRSEKLTEYEREGIREYWLIDPDARWADFFVLGEDGHYRRVCEDAEGVYHSEVLKGLKLPVRWLWERPPLREAIRYIEGD